MKCSGGNILEVRGLRVSYPGGIEVLWDVFFEVKEGEVLTLIGSNGAGKSTTIKTITGLMRPRAGEVVFLGKSILGKATHEIVAMGMVQIPEGRQLFPQMSVMENLILGAYPREFRAHQQDSLKWVLELFPRLGGRLKQRAGSMSGGEQQMVAIGRALMAKPRLLIIDEMSLGLAPVLVKELFKIIETINAQGVSVLLVEQNVKNALQVAHRAVVMENGRISLSGSAQEVGSNPHVRRSYLGIQ